MVAVVVAKSKLSNSKRGAYFKGRSKKWQSAQGYEVWDMELRHNVYGQQGGKPKLIRSVMRDQLGADLGAMSVTDLIVIQVKGGATARSGLAAARRKFRQYPFPPFVKRHIHVWLPRAREPEIIDCSEEPYEPCQDEEPSSVSISQNTSAF